MSSADEPETTGSDQGAEDDAIPLREELSGSAAVEEEELLDEEDDEVDDEVDDAELEGDDGQGFSEFMSSEDDDTSQFKTVGEYQKGTLLGEGAFGKVFKGLNTKTGQFVAIKEMLITDVEFVEEELPKIMSEIQLLRQLDHPNIVRYIDFYRTENCLNIILEYIENGSLSNILKQYGKFPESLTAIYTAQVLAGLDYLHSLDILHRDIKGANILITKLGVVKLADFGVATQLEPGMTSIDAVGTPYWMAPEIFEGEDATKACDIWSLGCTVLELICGTQPYSDLAPLQAMCQILDDEHPPYPPNISRELKEFLDCCFIKEPEQRHSAQQLLQHPWILRALGNDDEGQQSQPSPLEDLRTRVLSMDGHTIERVTSKQDSHTQYLEDKHRIRLSTPTFNQRAQLSTDVQQVRAICKEADREYDALLDSALRHHTALASDYALLTQKWKEAVRDRERYQLAFRMLTSRLESVEETYVPSDDKFAKLLFGNLAMESLKNAIRGVLYVKKGASTKWHKRHVALKEDFLFLYRAVKSAQQTPVEVVHLRETGVFPLSEKDCGKKHCFRITTGKRVYMMYAANARIMIKWTNCLSMAHRWWEGTLEPVLPNVIAQPRGSTGLSPAGSPSTSEVFGRSRGGSRTIPVQRGADNASARQAASALSASAPGISASTPSVAVASSPLVPEEGAGQLSGAASTGQLSSSASATVTIPDPCTNPDRTRSPRFRHDESAPRSKSPPSMKRVVEVGRGFQRSNSFILQQKRECRTNPLPRRVGDGERKATETRSVDIEGLSDDERPSGAPPAWRSGKQLNDRADKFELGEFRSPEKARVQPVITPSQERVDVPVFRTPPARQRSLLAVERDVVTQDRRMERSETVDVGRKRAMSFGGIAQPVAAEEARRPAVRELAAPKESLDGVTREGGSAEGGEVGETEVPPTMMSKSPILTTFSDSFVEQERSRTPPMQSLPPPAVDEECTSPRTRTREKIRKYLNTKKQRVSVKLQ